ncbi:hypothetical protein OG824_05155 [Streptomyces prunicolor]|uniref:hypothetical protein n=1 Tax=Streptomyces prunicolor TaxID=67348 RepID=UPI00224CC560|nr:hypothetical protein [Streptomyces prunicolor]MCX5234619.1 hypothetical protein [Streptomyces prunicolor]
MSATQNGSQVSGAGSGSSGGNGDDGSRKIRKFEAVIILLVGMVAGLVAGIAKRMMDHASYFEAIGTGVLVGISLPGFIIMIITYIRSQS